MNELDSNPEASPEVPPDGTAGTFLKVLSVVALIVGILAVLLVIPEGLTADNGIGVIVLSGGIGLLIASPFIWAAGKALELLYRIEVNTKKNSKP